MSDHQQPTYADALARAETGRQGLRAIVSRPHAPAEARQGANELSAALRVAIALAAAAARGRWSPELARLDEIQVWLRRTRLDDLGVQVPTTVRVGSYAATGPHIAGMGGSAPELAELSVPRIGIDLGAVLDGEPPGASSPNALTAPQAASPR